jgi:hypothetical protein
VFKDLFRTCSRDPAAIDGCTAVGRITDSNCESLEFDMGAVLEYLQATRSFPHPITFLTGSSSCIFYEYDFADNTLNTALSSGRFYEDRPGRPCLPYHEMLSLRIASWTIPDDAFFADLPTSELRHLVTHHCTTVRSRFSATTMATNFLKSLPACAHADQTYSHP